MPLRSSSLRFIPAKIVPNRYRSYRFHPTYQLPSPPDRRPTERREDLRLSLFSSTLRQRWLTDTRVFGSTARPASTCLHYHTNGRSIQDLLRSYYRSYYPPARTHTHTHARAFPSPRTRDRATTLRVYQRLRSTTLYYSTTFQPAYSRATNHPFDPSLSLSLTRADLRFYRFSWHDLSSSRFRAREWKESVEIGNWRAKRLAAIGRIERNRNGNNSMGFSLKARMIRRNYHHGSGYAIGFI